MGLFAVALENDDLMSTYKALPDTLLQELTDIPSTVRRLFVLVLSDLIALTGPNHNANSFGSPYCVFKSLYIHQSLSSLSL